LSLIESLQKALVDKGVTVAVFEALREYIGEMTRNEQCVEYGCRALKGILMHPYVTERERGGGERARERWKK
jgi:hypothetical protein